MMMTSTEMNAFDDMRQLARKTAALTRAAENLLDEVGTKASDDESRARLEDLAYLLGAAAEAADATVEAGLKLAQGICNNHRTHDA
jgi:hypothetical protein